MAFRTNELRNPYGLGNGSIWTYRTEDPLATVEGANYFPTERVSVGDVIHVTCLTNQNLETEAFADFQSYMMGDAGALTALGTSPYPGHNAVVFDGTSDYLTSPSDPFGGTHSYFTAVFIVNPTSVAAQKQFLFANSLARLTMVAGGVPQLLFTNINGPNTGAGTVPLVAGQDNVVHFAAYNDGVTTYASVWVDGALSVSNSTGTATGMTFGTYTDWRLFDNVAGTGRFAGEVKLAWITAGDTAAHYITPTDYDFGNVRDLGVDGSAPGVTPIVFYGGQQVAADWNAGTNQGSGADWTMSGDGVA